MKIKAIRVYQVDLPLHEGSYQWAGGKSVDVFDSTIVEVETDAGLKGYGEVCPLGSSYLPAYGAGVRAGILELGPHLLGLHPLRLGPLNLAMDQALKGHPYVKSAVDIACWDLLGKATNQSVCELLGGRFGKDFVLYRAISQAPATDMAENLAGYRDQGYSRFQLKVGGDVDEDIRRIKACSQVLDSGNVLVADANTGWLMHEAARVVQGVQDIDVYIEQPCLTYEQCLSIRERTGHAFVMDECVDCVDVLVKLHADRAADVVNIKISKFGGLTKAKLARDLCSSLGIAMTIEDSWGGDITTAAIACLAHSTPTAHLFSSTDFNSYVTVSTADNAPQREGGRMSASHEPGLGIAPKLDVLGAAVHEIS